MKALLIVFAIALCCCNTQTIPVSTAATVTPVSAQPQVRVGGYSLVSAKDVQNSAIIQSLAAYGAQNVTQQAIADGVAPSGSQFTISKINSVESQVVNGVNYRFNVQLTKGRGHNRRVGLPPTFCQTPSLRTPKSDDFLDPKHPSPHQYNIRLKD